MKQLIVIIFGVGILAGSAYYVARPHPLEPAAEHPLAGLSTTAPQMDETTPMVPAYHHPLTQQPHPIASKSAESSQPDPITENHNLDAAVVHRAVASLLSSQASYEEKRSAWKLLRDGGGLDAAIDDLQQRFLTNQASADCAAVLGHAYLQKCGVLSDVREQGILAMEADKLFDTALSLDPENWEARFVKAVALSYWPASMGKGQEVIQHFTTLIDQQEAQPQQPQFAESYLWLGDEYKKAGKFEDAHSVWERGAALFPNSQKLTERLASSR